MLLAERLAEDRSLIGEAFNFSNELQVSVLALVERILHAMASDLRPDVRGEATHEISHQYLSAAKARQRLKWSPTFSLEQGLARTIRWYRDFFAEAAYVS
jgi:CDP-glucose 4,6-dehydratase